MDEEEIKLLIKYPESLINNHKLFKEKDWKQIYEYLCNKRLDNELKESWLLSQNKFGEYKYKALGQLFSRFATINKGFKTLNDNHHRRN